MRILADVLFEPRANTGDITREQLPDSSWQIRHVPSGSTVFTSFRDQTPIRNLADTEPFRTWAHDLISEDLRCELTTGDRREALVNPVQPEAGVTFTDLIGAAGRNALRNRADIPVNLYRIDLPLGGAILFSTMRAWVVADTSSALPDLP